MFVIAIVIAIYNSKKARKQKVIHEEELSKNCSDFGSENREVDGLSQMHDKIDY